MVKKKSYYDGVSEAVLQARLFHLLRHTGFSVAQDDGTVVDLFFHVFDSRKTVGAGMPDTPALRAKPVEFWWFELKTERGRLSPKQKVWKAVLEGLEEATGGLVKYRLLRPSGWAALVEELGGRDHKLFV